jgi:hypothetical protein
MQMVYYKIATYHATIFLYTKENNLRETILYSIIMQPGLANAFKRQNREMVYTVYTRPVKQYVIGEQHGHWDVTIVLLLPSLRRRPLTKYEIADMIDEEECYHTTLCVTFHCSTGNQIFIFHYSIGQDYLAKLITYLKEMQ